MPLSVWQRWLNQQFPSARRPARPPRRPSRSRPRVEPLEDRVVPNSQPVINNQSFAINENTPAGTVVGTVVATDPDPGQSLTYSIVGMNPGDTFALDEHTGRLTVASAKLLDFETRPGFTLTVRVLDNGDPAAANSAQVQINLTDLNEAPVVFPQSFSINRGSQAGTLVGTVQGSDPDNNQSLTYAITAGNEAGAFAINPATGAVTVANSAALQGLAGPVGLTVQVRDSGSPPLTSSATLTITPFGVGPGANQAPVINAQSFSVSHTAATGAVVGTVQASDPDAGQSLTYAITSGNAAGAFAVNAVTGQLTVANGLALQGLTSPVTLTVQVTDNGSPLLSSAAAVTVTLLDNPTGTNHAPVIGNQTFSADRASAFGTAVGTVVASDPDPGQALTYAITSSTAPGAFTINPATGQLTVSGGLQGLTSPVTLTVQVRDSGSPQMAASATVNVNLTNGQSANHSPVIGNQTFMVDRTTPVGAAAGTVVASDPDPGQSLNYTITFSTAPGTFVINAATGQITVAGGLQNVFSPVTMTVQVADNGNPALSAFASVTVILTNGQGTNQPPVISPQTFSVSNNAAVGAAVGTVQASDPDAGQTLTYSITGGNMGGAFAINPATGQITVGAPLQGLGSPVTLTVQVTDSGSPAQSASAPVTINLTAPGTNQPPSINPQTFSVSNNAAVGTAIGTVQASDPENQSLTYAITGGNMGGAFAIDPATGALSVAGPLQGLGSPAVLTVQVTDPGNLSASAAVTINLTAPGANQPPVISPQAFSVSRTAAAGAVVGTVQASDPDAGQTLTYSITGGNMGNIFAINPASGVLTVAAGASLQNLASPVTLTVQVTDSGSPALSSSAAITVNLTTDTGTNQPPVINPQAFSVSRSAAANAPIGTVVASDPDPGQTLTYAIIAGNGAGAFAIDPATGALTVANAAALDSLSSPAGLIVSVTDSGSPAATAMTMVTVGLLPANPNQPPVINAQGFSVDRSAANGTAIGTVQASDPDQGQSLTYAITGGNGAGAFAINAATGQITVANAAALAVLANPVALTVQVTDSGAPARNASATITLTLTPLNRPPVVANQSFTVGENSAAGTPVGTVQASDPDAGQLLSYAITGGNGAGAFAINAATGQITVANPAALNFETTPFIDLTVTVTDTGSPQQSASATVRVNVGDVNEAPVVADQTFSVSRVAAAGAVVGTVQASDPDQGQTLTYSITAGNAAGAFAIDPATGQLTVANADALAALADPVALVVTVTDSGNPARSATASVSVGLVPSAANQPPVVADQAFTVSGAAVAGTSVGTVQASDPEHQALTFAITAGNGAGAFAINPTSGQITVRDAQALAALATPASLTVTVTDNGVPARSAAATVTVTITSENHAPVIADQAFSVSRTAAAGTAVGTVAASDPDQGQVLTYAITAGNGAGAFAIDAATGAITVASAAALQNVSGTVSLTVQVTDNGSGALSAAATVTITVTTPSTDRPPVNTVPGPQTACEDVPLTIRGLSVSDPAATASTRLRVTLSVRCGTVSVRTDASGGVRSGNVSGNRTGTVTLTGTLAQIQATLAAGVTYLGGKDFSGTDTLTMTSKDLGTGLSDTDQVSITVRSSLQQAADLQKMVEKLRYAGALSRDTASSLEGKLDIKVKTTRDRSAATVSVNAFISQMNDLVKRGKLNPAKANPLLDAAQCLLQSINS